MKIVFMGTPDFAVPTLKKIYESGYEIPLVFCQPDKPRGRSRALVPPEIKVAATELGLSVCQPESLKDAQVQKIIKDAEPDFIVVAAYGKLLPKEVLDIPKYACINVHASLLPKYRGASPIQWSILSGDKITGVTTMLMGEGLDTGDILLQSTTEIGEDENASQLFERLSMLGADLLIETIKTFPDIIPQKQDEAKASYSRLIKKDMSEIDWNMSAQEINNKVRGLYGWPVAKTYFKNKMVKIYSGKVGKNTTEVPGTVIDNAKKLVVACGGGTAYEIISLQLEGKKRMDAASFLLGNKINTGERLG